MKKGIVKAEILFSRKCNLKCSYCNMPNGKDNTLSVIDWFTGMEQLKKLDCKFCAFYGAEPLLEFEKLIHVLPYAENIGIDCTLITNGTVSGTKEMLLELNKGGLKSLTMSYDISALDKSSRLKTDLAVRTLSWFKTLKNVRDVAAVVTLTNTNYLFLPTAIKMLSKLGIWTFFDMYHWNRYTTGISKCSDQNPLFCFDNHEKLVEILEEVKTLRNKGFLVHNNDSFIDAVKKDKLSYSWNCAEHKEFPSWLTIDCDGVVIPCDDFQIRNPKYNITNIYEQFDEFSKYMKNIVQGMCLGCLWQTHIGAVEIKKGTESINDYIHGK